MGGGLPPWGVFESGVGLLWIVGGAVGLLLVLVFEVSALGCFFL